MENASMTDKFNNKVETFRGPDGVIHERRTSLDFPGEVAGSESVVGRSDFELESSGFVRVPDSEAAA